MQQIAKYFSPIPYTILAFTSSVLICIRSMALFTCCRSSKSRLYTQTIRHASTLKTTPTQGEDPHVSLTFQYGFSVAKLLLHNPTRRNALTYSMMEQLDRHIYALDKWSRHGIIDYDYCTHEAETAGNSKSPNNNARAVILTGSGVLFLFLKNTVFEVVISLFIEFRTISFFSY